MAVVLGAVLRRVRIDVHAADRIFHGVSAGSMALARVLLIVVRVRRCEQRLRVGVVMMVRVLRVSHRCKPSRSIAGHAATDGRPGSLPACLSEHVADGADDLRRHVERDSA